MKFAVLLAVVALCQATPTRVAPDLLSCLETKRSCDAMIILKDTTEATIDAINLQRFANSGVKTTAMVAALREFTGKAQGPILDFLSRRKASNEVQGFWIANRISVKGASMLLVDQLLAAFPGEIAEIRDARVAHIEVAPPKVFSSEPNVLEWGVDNVDADLAWEAGVTGTGVVVSSIDTGVRGTHNVLRDNKRASYDWFDASSVPADVPTDGNGHGTHTMGSMVGKTGTGVAPDAEWIHCRAFDDTEATEAALLKCGQWITCPTLANGTGEDCTQKPHVVSNSWGSGSEDAFYNEVIFAWQAADITPVFAIGNGGPGCRTVNSPGDQRNVISVGATTADNNKIATYSSHGPSLINTLIKPECSAPGDEIRSSAHISDTLFMFLSGTSMAAPHVAGSVALVRSKNPNATFEEVKTALFQSTFRVDMPTLVCTGGGVNTTYPWPNNAHGWGKINVNDALMRI